MKVLIVGLGLIGGSFAKAVKCKTDDWVAGLDACPKTVEKALAEGAIDQGVTSVPADTDVVLLALYPRAAVEFVRTHSGELPQGSMVIDLCGVKRFVCDEVNSILKDRDVSFIGGHPMAGREFFGFDASVADLFQGASMILTPSDDISRQQWLFAELFFRRLGFSGVTRTTPDHHDQMIALTSQLAHIVSSAYVQNPDASGHMGFSAGSFHDMTRVARLNEEMWTELFLLNPDHLSDQIGQLIQTLDDFKAAIEAGNEERLCAMLKKGRLIKEELNRQRENEQGEAPCP